MFIDAVHFSVRGDHQIRKLAAYVYPDKMIDKLQEFDSKEIVAFLHYCVCYKERFCDGAYGGYAKEGYVGCLLVRLRELQQEI